VTSIILLGMLATNAYAQENLFTKDFKQFKGIVPGVDFFAKARKEITPFEKPIAEARKKLASILDGELAAGAIFICSSRKQKDSVYEPRAFQMGYKWLLSPLTPEASAQEMIDRIKERMGGEVPQEMIERMSQRSSGLGSRMVETTVMEMGKAIMLATLNPEKEFRLSRIDDMNRSPLADWLDIGIASYAAGGLESHVSFLQRRLEEAFPIEDILFMSRPVVAPSADGGSGQGGGGTVVIRMDRGSGGGQTHGRGGGGSRSMPKDVQDRMMFDAQAATIFAHLIEKWGIEKVKEIVRLNREGEDIQDVLEREEYLGSDFETVENEWSDWVKSQKVERREMRMMSRPPQQQNPPKI